MPDSVTFGGFEVFAGAWNAAASESQMIKAIGVVPPDPPPPLTPSEEAVVHALVAAQLGDLELDIGRSVAWAQFFTDDMFVSDVNYGDQRYWVVDWNKSFPMVGYIFTRVNYFTDTANFRKQQFLDAENAARIDPNKLTYDDSDWILFIDAHEGLSVDNRSLPDDYNVLPFKSFMYREIARANAAGADNIALPFFVFLRHDHIQSVTYDVPQAEDADGNPVEPLHPIQALGVPYYLPYQGLKRMWKVSALRSPTFDWTLLDTPVTISGAGLDVKMQIISYGHAHWNLLDIVPPATTVPPLTAENDDGWKQRCLLAQVMPIGGLPTGDSNDPVGTWEDPSSDPAGVRGPWAPDTYGDRLLNVWIPVPPPPIDASVAGVLTPLYYTVQRLNMRDGVWYQGDAVGNIPLRWNTVNQTWEPVYPPEEWHATT